MPFIGNQPALSYTSFAKQDFTTSATTSYTLDQPVANANELALFINFVRQEPTTAYSASGTSLTLTSATSASDDMYCVFLGKAVQTVNPPSGSVGTAQIADLAVTSGKLASGVLPDNTPAFHVNSPDNGSIASGTEVALSFTTELFDTNSAYDTSTHRFTPQVAGYYFIYGGVRFNSTNTFSRINLTIFKNTSDALSARNDNIEYNTTNLSGAIELNGSTDYVQLKAYQNSGISLAVTNSASLCFFGGFLIKKI